MQFDTEAKKYNDPEKNGSGLSGEIFWESENRIPYQSFSNAKG